MSTTGDPVLDVFADFVQYRKSGRGLEDAWDASLSSGIELTEKQHKRLQMLAQGWEQREGTKYPAQKSEDAANITMMGRPKGFPTSLDEAQMAEVSAPGQSHALDDLEDSDDSAAYFGPNTALLMYFDGFEDPLQVRVPEGSELVVGRSAPDDVAAPHINLEPFNAGQQGVSREHAAFTNQHNRLVLTDLGSLNYTYVNQARIHVQEMRVIHDGDDIHFGRLLARIRFWHT